MLRVFAATSVFALCLTCIASADMVIYNNLDPDNPLTPFRSFSTEISDQFATRFQVSDGSSFSLSSVEVVLQGILRDLPVEISLWTDVGTRPGFDGRPNTVLESWTAVVPTDTSGSLIQVESALNPVLEANQYYWLAVRSLTLYRVVWWYGSSVETESLYGRRTLLDSDTWHLGYSSEGTMRLTGEPVAVPEASSLAMSLMAGIGIVVYFRSRLAIR